MSKGLEALSEMVIHLNNNYAKTHKALEDFRNIQKELEALEIIKSIGFSLEFDESQNEWFLHISGKGTGVKIYDLLKEALL